MLLSGGEPLARPDLFALAQYGRSLRGAHVLPPTWSSGAFGPLIGMSARSIRRMRNARPDAMHQCSWSVGPRKPRTLVYPGVERFSAGNGLHGRVQQGDRATGGLLQANRYGSAAAASHALFF